MSQFLEVRLFDQHAGTVSIAGDLRSPEDWRFSYSPDYIAADGVPLSVSLQLRAEPFEGAVVRNWFTNLLPEGAVREAISRRLRIPGDDDFMLLEKIGGECAGAVSIGNGTPAAADSETDLETILYLAGDEANDEGAWATVAAPHRMSLAGAQDKIAIARNIDGSLRLPGDGELSTHILKPESERFRGLRDLEALGLRLARRVGLNVAPAELVVVGGRKALLIERYDRESTMEGRVRRLHQEDFCQVLGYPSGLKYQEHGGPGLFQIADQVRRLALGPESVQGLLDWVIYNALIGNADAHAKNLSILCGQDGTRRLAPFYDLVPTMYFSEARIDRRPALRIGNATRIDAVTADDWRLLAKEAGYAGAFAIRRVAHLAEMVIEQVRETGSQLTDEGADGERMVRASDAILANASRVYGDVTRSGGSVATS